MKYLFANSKAKAIAKEGLGILSSSFLNSFLDGKCQKCDSEIPDSAIFGNAIVINKTEIQLYCAKCRGNNTYIRVKSKPLLVQVDKSKVLIALNSFVNEVINNSNRLSIDNFPWMIIIAALRTGLKKFEVGTNSGWKSKITKEVPIYENHKLFGRVETGQYNLELVEVYDLFEAPFRENSLFPKELDLPYKGRSDNNRYYHSFYKNTLEVCGECQLSLEKKKHKNVHDILDNKHLIIDYYKICPYCKSKQSYNWNERNSFENEMKILHNYYGVDKVFYDRLLDIFKKKNIERKKLINNNFNYAKKGLTKAKISKDNMLNILYNALEAASLGHYESAQLVKKIKVKVEEEDYLEIQDSIYMSDYFKELMEYYNDN